MTAQTGGSVYEVSKKHPASEIYSKIVADLRAQYRLGFAPDQAAATDGYHRIGVSVNRKDLSAQARDGYYMGK